MRVREIITSDVFHPRQQLRLDLRLVSVHQYIYYINCSWPNMFL